MRDADRVKALLRVIDNARADVAFTIADEVDGNATERTRKVRLEMIRDALLGVGDLEARRALGLLQETINA